MQFWSKRMFVKTIQKSYLKFKFSLIWFRIVLQFDPLATPTKTSRIRGRFMIVKIFLDFLRSWWTCLNSELDNWTSDNRFTNYLLDQAIDPQTSEEWPYILTAPFVCEMLKNRSEFIQLFFHILVSKSVLKQGYWCTLVQYEC